MTCVDGTDGRKGPVTLIPLQGSGEDEQLFLEVIKAGSLLLSLS